MKKHTFEIENNDGSTIMTFEVSLDENGEIDITRFQDCSWADVDTDYVFNTDNQLFRIQAD